MTQPTSVTKAGVLIAFRTLVEQHDTPELRAFAHRFEVELDRVYGEWHLVPAPLDAGLPAGT